MITKYNKNLPFYVSCVSANYQKDGNNVIVLYNQNYAFSFFVIFSKELDDKTVLINENTIAPNENYDFQFFNTNEMKKIEKININPKYRKQLVGFPAIPGTILFFSYHNRSKFVKIEGEEAGIISAQTVFTKIPSIELDSLESLPTEEAISERIVRMVRNRKQIHSKTLLIIGNEGCGKTNLIKLMRKNIKGVQVLDLPLFSSELEFNSSDHIDSVFDINDGVILIDDIDILKHHPIATATVHDKIKSVQTRSVIVIATSRTSPYALPPQLATLFENTVSFGSLTYKERKETIQNTFGEIPEEIMEFIARETAGSSRAEFDTALRVLRGFPEFSESQFVSLMKTIASTEKPLMMRQSTVEPYVCGYKTEMREIRLILDVTFHGDEEKHKMLQYNGILLHGVSGNGKSLIIKRMAHEFEVPFFVVEFDKIFSKYLGDSEKAIRDVFASARFFSPSVIVIEDIDALGGKRSDESGVGGRVLSALLNEIDGVTVKSKVVVIATTNALNLVDSALVRPGRFDRLIEIGNPTKEDRIEMFAHLREKTPVSKSITNEQLAEMTNGMNCSDIQSFFRHAAINALREGQAEVSLPYFESGMNHIKERKQVLKLMEKKKSL